MSNQNQNLTSEELLQKIYENTERTRKYILWGRIMSFIYLVLILVPIILAVIYLPPVINQALDSYQGLLKVSGQTNTDVINTLKESGFDLNQLLKMKQ